MSGFRPIVTSSGGSRASINRPHRLWEVAIIAGIALVGAGFVGLAGWRLSRPYLIQWRQRQELAQLNAQRDALLEENIRLRRDTATNLSPEGYRYQAQRLGYLGDGERALRFLPAENFRRTRPAAPAPPKVTPAIRWKESIKRRLGG